MLKHNGIDFNNPSFLPPVDCPLLIIVDGVVKRATRDVFVSDRKELLSYVLHDGTKLRGRFYWTYP